MPEAMKPIAELDVVHQFFITMGTNPILGILSGILVTAVIQSSTASIGILQSMAFSGMVPWNAAVYIVLGQNIGTCLTAVISGLGASKNAQAAAYVHLVYNAVGAAIFCAAGVIFFTFFNPSLGASTITATNISMVHTGYNVAALILLFPFGKLILKIAEKMAGIGKPGSTTDASDLPELDESILETPSYAIENSSKAITKLIDLMRTNLVLSVSIFRDKDYRNISLFWSKANEIDRVNDKISEFMTKLYHEKLNEDENNLVSTLIHITMNLRRISNRSKGFAKLAEGMRDSGIKDTYTGVGKFAQLYEKTMHCYDHMSDAFMTHDAGIIYQTMIDADRIELMKDMYKPGHLAQASDAGYSVETGIAYSEAARHLARIAHNIKSVVETIPHDESVDDEVEEAYTRR